MNVRWRFWKSATMALRASAWLLTVACASLLLGGCREREGARAVEASRRAGTDPPVVQVEVRTVRPQALPRRIPIVGTLFPAEEAVISTKASGILRRTFVDLGSVVPPGAPLAQVDTVDYEVAVAQTQAALAEVLARLGIREVPDETFDLQRVSVVRRAAAQLENARFTNERLTSMQAAYAEQELHDAATQLRVAEAAYQLAIDEAAALVASARERQSLLQMARQKLADTLTQTPPIPTTRGAEGADEWVVAARLVTEGQYVNSGEQLYRLLITNPLKLRSKVPERYSAEVRVGQRVELENVEGVLTPQGRIARLSPAVDPASRTFEVEALVENESNALKPGAFAKGVIVAEDAAQTVFVPAEAVLTDGGATRLFVVDNGVARHRSVQTGRQADGLVEVLSGLHDGEQIVTRGTAGLTDGMAVQVRSGS